MTKAPRTHHDWLLAHLAANGPRSKREVVAAWRRERPGRPLNSLEVAFSRAKGRGLVTGEVGGFQGPSVWRLVSAGEAPFVWKRWRGRARAVRGGSVFRNGVYSPPWGAVRSRPSDWMAPPHGAASAPAPAAVPLDNRRPSEPPPGPTDDDLRRLARERALARLIYGL